MYYRDSYKIDDYEVQNIIMRILSNITNELPAHKKIILEALFEIALRDIFTVFSLKFLM